LHGINISAMKKQTKDVGILIYPSCTSSMITGVWDILSLANHLYIQQSNSPLFNLKLIGETKSPINSFSGLPLTPHCSISTRESFDIIYIPGFMGDEQEIIKQNKKIINWVSKINSGKTIISAACNGNILLAESGKLDNHSATTHWSLKEKFTNTYRKVKLQPEKIIVDNGNIISAAGVTSCFNLSLHLINRFSNAEIALSCAKLFLVDSARKIQTPYQMVHFSKSHGDEVIVKAQEWLENNFKESISLPTLESVSNTSAKTLTRRFKKATGETPMSYLQKLRIETAKRLLESSDITFNEVTWEVGYNDSSSFHRAFKQETGLTPIDYRNKFSLA
jgi:transcriptional regulator GlxA family with amidase domain